MFESDFVDAFSRIPWWVVPLLYVPTTAVLVGLALQAGVSLPLVAVQMGVGWFVWTLMEYWLHRTVFHWVPDVWWGEKFHFFLHGVHHQWFNDRYRLVMPPAASIAVAVVVFGALSALGAVTSAWIDPSWVYAVFAGIVVGYMFYDLTHYYIHHAKPTNRVMLALRSHHNKHHHNARYAGKKFGVSCTLWDHVFGTYE
jgi:dihydroceramide fatty acyl 2-hydroxylase